MNLEAMLAGLSFTTVKLPPSAPAEKQCGGCSKALPEKTKTCAKCKLVYYCSKECQTTAWKTHKATCQKPEEVPMMFANGIPTSFDDFKTFQVPLWDKKQDEAEQHTRNTSTFPKKLNKAKEQTPIDPQSRGFKKNKATLDKLLKEENYTDIDKLLKRDSITSSERNWLKNAAEQGHVPMMHRLAIILANQITKHDRSKVEDAVRWYHLGKHCTELDITCNTDASTSAALNISYTIGSTLIEKLSEQEKATYFAKEYALKIISSWTPKENHPSPEWVVASGMDVFMGVKSLKPQNEWYPLRLAKHKELTCAKDPEASGAFPDVD